MYIQPLMASQEQNHVVNQLVSQANAILVWHELYWSSKIWGEMWICFLRWGKHQLSGEEQTPIGTLGDNLFHGSSSGCKHDGRTGNVRDPGLFL